MNFSMTRPLMLLLIGVICVKQTSLTVVKMVKRGTTVSLLCSNLLKEPSYAAWFKQSNGSLPRCIITQYVNTDKNLTKPPDSHYFSGFKSDHIEMTVNGTFYFLKIVNVDVSDSGTFYCGSFVTNYMMFHNKTQLVVENETDQHREDTASTDCGTNEEMSRAHHIYYALTLVLSGLVLLSTVFVIVVVIKLKNRNTKTKDTRGHRHNGETSKRLQQEEDDADLNYAALNLERKKGKRPVRSMKEPNVIYASTR